MKIIDKYKDYWDHQAHLYGDDPMPVYDRRGSTKFTHKELIRRIVYDDFSAGSLLDSYTRNCEKQMKTVHVGVSKTFPIKMRFDSEKYEFGVIIGRNIYLFHIIQLSITYTYISQHPFVTEREFNGDIELFNKFSLKKDLGYKPIHLVKAHHQTYDAKMNWRQHFFNKEFEDVIEYPELKTNVIIEKKSSFNCENPILIGTKISFLIPAEDIYKELDNYLRSFYNDKDQQSKGLTDVDKAINHGFDKKFSFRHPIRL
jgi:hypothetical protein